MCSASKTTTMHLRFAYELGWDVYTYLHRLYFESIVLPSLLHATRAMRLHLDCIPIGYANARAIFSSKTEYIMAMHGAKQRFHRCTRLRLDIVDHMPLMHADDETAPWRIGVRYDRSQF